MRLRCHGVEVCCLAGVLTVLAAGCSSGEPLPKLGEVTGVVTLDGKPLPGAVVMFAPVSGRMSTGMTDAEGKYDLTYNVGTKGALIGKHAVRITTQSEDPVQRSPEKLPAKYNHASTLDAEVKEGKNDVPFELSSK